MSMGVTEQQIQYLCMFCKRQLAPKPIRIYLYNNYGAAYKSELYIE